MASSAPSSLPRAPDEPPAPVGVAWPDVAAVAALVVLGLVAFAPALAGAVPLVRDFPGFTLPSRHVWQYAWSHGAAPQWNPWVGVGLPVMAAPVHGALYPGHLPLLLGPVSAVLPALFAAHAVLAGVGAYAWLRLEGVRALPALVGAVPWVVGGYAVSMWYDGEKVLSGAFVPWAIAFLVRGARARAPAAWVAAAAVALALMALAGDPFLWLDTFAVALPLAYAAAREVRGVRGALLAVASRALSAGLLALAMAAPSLLPAWILRADTERAAALASPDADVWSMHPLRLLELVAPGAFGDPTDLDRYPGGAFAEDPSVQALPWAVSIYAGAAALLFAPLVARGRRTAALVVVLVAGVLAALGRHTPAYGALRAVVLPLAWMRYPEKHVLVALAALSALSALGCDRALSGAVRVRRGGFVLAGAAVASLALAPAELRPWVLRGLAHAAAAAALLAAGVLVARTRPLVAPLLVVVVAADLSVASVPLLEWGDAARLARVPELASAILARPHVAPPRLARARADHLNVETLPENLPSVFGIAAYPGHDPAKSANLRKLAGALGDGNPQLGALLRLDAALVPDDGVPPTWSLLPLSGGPRVWLTGSVRVLDDAAAVAALRAPGLDPTHEAFVAPSPEARDLATSPSGDCDLVSHEPEHLRFRCTTDTAALAVVSEQWSRGWRATVDGAPVAVVRVQLALRGVYLTRGTHDVELSYSTPGLPLGLGCAGLGLTFTLLAIGRSIRRGSRRRPG